MLNHPLLQHAYAHSDEEMCLLYSGRKGPQTGNKSFLALNPVEVVESDQFDALDILPRGSYWFGYLSYELKHATEKLTHTKPTSLHMPRLRFVRYENLYCFDHEAESLTQLTGTRILESKSIPTELPTPTLDSLSSNMTKHDYLRSIDSTISHIKAGDFYQANITRKFFGKWKETDPFRLFLRLCDASPAPYSAYIKHGENAILSSSPELFLASDGTQLTSRPIKGTLPIHEPAKKLAESSKDQSENLMIVDLVRNDMARICTKGSVKVEELFSIQSFQTLHHMVSTIEGTLTPQHRLSETIAACFPPGSMTGAPKIAAMQWCAQQEKIDRGIYSGAIGWITPATEMDLSVVIRTLICDNEYFEFQVGGGIVADSDPEKEWQETLTKARGTCAALGISIEEIAAL